MKWLLLVALIAGTRTASAYPYFQRSSGTARCAQCHIAPVGGGLLTYWGIEESSDTIARGGDGHFLHGAFTLPDWLLIGGDLRGAVLANDVGGTSGVALAAFPMQAELAVGVHGGPWSVVALVGARGRVRSAPQSSNPASEVPETSLASYVISREHYVMWQPDAEAGPYVRAGRFAAPYGLRLADHTAYVRRYLGYNLQEETYGLGAGWLAGGVELHATAFVYDPLQGATRKEVGGALLVESQPGDVLVIGASARASIAAADTRLQAGLHIKLWLEPARLLFQGQVDGVRQLFDGPGDRWQLAAYAGPTWIPTRGVYTGVGYQAFAEDLHVRGVTRHSLDAWISFLPRAHSEIMLSARAQRIGPSEEAYLAMLQFHYWL